MTVVNEEALANIRAFGREIGIMPQKANPAIQNVNKEFLALSNTLKGMGTGLTQIIPALGAVGLGAGSAAVGIGALLYTLTNAAKRVVELKYASKELGMSERDIRSWQGAAERVGVSAQSMTQGLANFKKTTDGLKFNIGGARDELYALGAGPIVQRMQAATNQADKLRVAFQFKDALMKDDPSGFKARMFFDQIGLGADKARLSFEQYEAVQKNMKPMSPEQIKAADDYNKQLITLGESWDHLVITTAKPLFPLATATMNAISQGIESNIKQFDALDTALQHAKDKWARGDYAGAAKTALFGDADPKFAHQGPASERDDLLGIVPKRRTTPRLFGGGRFKYHMRGEELASQEGWNALQESLRTKAPTSTKTPSIDDIAGGGFRVPELARGGIVTKQTLAMIGEGGPEAVIPLDTTGTGGAANKADEVHTVKEGTFQALMDFKEYLGAAGGGGVGGAPMGALPGFGGGGGGAGAGGGAGGMGSIPGGGGGNGVGTDGQPTTGSHGGAGSAGDRDGTPDGGGSGNLASQREEFKKELDADPQLRKLAIGAMSKEGGVQSNLEQLMNMAAMRHQTLRKALYSGQYGPVTGRNRLSTAALIAAGEKAGNAGEAALGKVYGGSNITDYATDQGMKGDPNYDKYMSNPKYWGMHKVEGAWFSAHGEAGRKWATEQRARDAQANAAPAAPNGQQQGANTGDGGKAVSGGGAVTHEGTGRMVSPEIMRSMAYAGTIAGVRTNVAHGDEPGHARHHQGASSGDVDLYDESGRKLDVRNPEDKAKMEQYIEAAAASGSSGIGFGKDGSYMGFSRMHVGAGSPAVWGAQGKTANAPDWVARAYARGRANQVSPEQQQAAITNRIDGAVDTAAAGSQKIDGKVHVTVNSNGTAAKTTAKSEGALWQRSTIENYKQMQPTSQPVRTVEMQE
jgi:hypothetical protein